MLQYLEALAKDVNMITISINVMPKNKSALKLYEKMGFKKLGHNVVVHDVKHKTKIEDVIDTDIVFVCVPTPSAPNGDCDTSIVESVVRELADLKYDGIVCIKSTVKPGTTEKLSKYYPSLNLSLNSKSVFNCSLHWRLKLTLTLSSGLILSLGVVFGFS